jgi:hypothetical protein
VTALQTVIGALPRKFPAAVLVVQHLDPRHKSLLAELLARRTPLVVKEAVNRDFLSLPIGAGPMLTRDAVRRVLESHRTESVGDVPYHRDGDERKTTVVLTPLVSPQGELIGVLALSGGDDTGCDAGAKTR